MNILITGGTGRVGAEVARLLAEKGLTPRVLTRSAEKIAGLPTGTAGVIADLRRPETLPKAFAGSDRLVLITAMGRTEAAEGIAAVEAARAARVQRIVFMSVHEVEQLPEVPHFRSKVDIAQRLAAAGIPWTEIRPNNFFQNDYWFKEAILDQAVYPQPVGPMGTNRVDVRDIADAIATAVTEDGYEGQQFPLNGPDCLTGEDIARTWSRHLGREVRYAGDDLEAWGKRAARTTPEWLVHDLKTMYAYVQKHGLTAGEADFAQQARVVKHPPRRFDDFVRETVAAWSLATRTARR